MMPGPKIAPLKTPILLRLSTLFKCAFTSESSTATPCRRISRLTITLLLSLALLLMGGLLKTEEAYAACTEPDKVFSAAVSTTWAVPTDCDTVIIKAWAAGGGGGTNGSVSAGAAGGGVVDMPKAP